MIRLSNYDHKNHNLFIAPPSMPDLKMGFLWKGKPLIFIVCQVQYTALTRDFQVENLWVRSWLVVVVVILVPVLLSEPHVGVRVWEAPGSLWHPANSCCCCCILQVEAGWLLGGAAGQPVGPTGQSCHQCCGFRIQIHNFTIQRLNWLTLKNCLFLMSKDYYCSGATVLNHQEL